MPKWLKIGTSFLLVLSTLFVWIGYAALSDELTVEGILAFILPDYNEVVITDVKNEDGTRAKWVVPTTIDSTVNLAAGETVTYTITVKNYSDRIRYTFSGLEYDANVANNGVYESGGLTVTASLAIGEEVPPGESKTFTATYAVTAENQNTDIRTLLNYKFGVHVESMGDLAVDNSLKQFANILNDTTVDEYGKTPLDRITENMTIFDNGTGGYIGNVVEGESDDTELIESLFGENLTVTLPGQPATSVNVTCMIKNEEINGRNSMTLYLTPDKISGGWFGSGTVTVYASVFYKDENGVWESFGDMYTGTAETNNYNYGGWGEDNSFNTDTWTSTEETYKVCDASTYTINGTIYTVDAHSYTIAAGQSIDAVTNIKVTNENWRALLQMHNVASAILGSGIYSESSEAIKALRATKAKVDAMIAKGQNNILQGDAVVMMKELSHILKSFANT